jgi:hypothetical protein
LPKAESQTTSSREKSDYEVAERRTFMSAVVQDPGPVHNHSSADLKKKGECPACDALHFLNESRRRARTDAGERAARAVDYLLSIGKPPFSTDIKKSTAKLFGSSLSSVERILAIRLRNDILFERVKNGEIGIADASRKAGFIEYSGQHPAPSVLIFGKGDKFWEAVSPLHSYLKGWKRKSYKFSHLPPREARLRIKRIDQLIAMLEEAKEDLTVRSDKTLLATPSK